MKETTKRRNERLRKRYAELIDAGTDHRQAQRIVADEFLLAPRTVRDIWYGQT